MKNCDIDKWNYIKIPEVVEGNNNLAEGAKLIYGRIFSLTQKWGYCKASNGWFAKKYSRTKQCISKWIKQLESENLIKIEYIGALGNQERRLSIIIDSLSTTVEGVSTTVEGLSIIIDHNNISNNISNNNREGTREKEQNDFYKFEETPVIELVSSEKKRGEEIRAAAKIEEDNLEYLKAAEKMKEYFEMKPDQITAMIDRTFFDGDWVSTLNDFWAYYCDNRVMTKRPLQYLGRFEQWMKREKQFLKSNHHAITSNKEKTNTIITKESFTGSVEDLYQEGYG